MAMLPSVRVLVLLAVWATVGRSSGLQRKPGQGMEHSGLNSLHNLNIQVIQSRGFPDQDQDQEQEQEQEQGSKLHNRAPRGAAVEDADADTGEQQSTFSHSYENEFFTTPRATQFTNYTTLENEAETRADDSNHHNETDSGITHIRNPLFPVTDSSYSAYAILFLSLVVLAVGIVGNLAVMCIVWHNYYMRSSWNYLLASLAFWDFLVLCFCLPVVVFNELTNKRLLGEISCRLVPYMEVTSLGVTSFSLCALGIDRFHAATTSSQPPSPTARRVEHCRSVLLKLLFVWVGSMVLASPELLLWQLSQAVSPSTGALVDTCSIHPTSPSTLPLPDSLYSLLHSYHQARMWWYFGCYFCLPVVFTLLCQLATCHVANDANAAAASLASQRSHGDRLPSKQPKTQRQQVERQLSCTVLALAVVYAICTLPENVCNIVLAYTATSISENTAALLALINHFLLFFKASVTPVLLLCLCKSLGEAFMDCCCCCCEECHPANSSPSHTGHSLGIELKLKSTNETSSSSIFFDKAKESATILSISSSS